MGSPEAAHLAPNVLGLSHVGIKASDFERSCAFYGEFLGFAEQCRLRYLDTGRLMLACFKVSEEQWIEVFDGLAPGENRMHQVAFRVGNAEAVRRRLRKLGAPVPDALPTGQMGNFNFVVPDPAGQGIEFVEHRPGGLTARDAGKFLPPTRISDRLIGARIVAPALEAEAPFYAALDLPFAGLAANGRCELRTPSGDVVEFVADSHPPAQFSLAVEDLEATRAALERSPYRSRYRWPLAIMDDAAGRRKLDLLDPDGTCIRLVR